MRAPMLDFLARRGLHGGLCARRGESQALPVPRVRMVRVPTRRGGSRARRCLRAAKLRALTEPLRLRGRADGESVAEFVGRRLGREVSRRSWGRS